LTGENGGENFRARLIRQSHGDCGTSLAGGATAHRVHDDEDGALLLLQSGVHFLRRAQFLKTYASEFFAHGTNKFIRKHRNSLTDYCVQIKNRAALHDAGLPSVAWRD
jgi:hypothetical protein